VIRSRYPGRSRLVGLDAMARYLPLMFVTLSSACVLVRCSTSAPPTPDAGHKVISVLPDGAGLDVVCGALNQSCCSSSGCNSGLTCNPMGAAPTCVPCGANGQPCCVSVESGVDINACTSATLACQTVVLDAAGSMTTCVPCGTVGSPCCAGGCTASGSCCDQIMSACVGADARCASGSTCAGGSCAP
jgi:hypothetical protein